MSKERDEIYKYLTDAGFLDLREIPGRGICGLKPFIFTTGLCYNLQMNDFNIYDGRYCFPTFEDAFFSLKNWDGIGDPPGDWIKHKGRTEYSNPKLKNLKK